MSMSMRIQTKHEIEYAPSRKDFNGSDEPQLFDLICNGFECAGARSEEDGGCAVDWEFCKSEMRHIFKSEEGSREPSRPLALRDEYAEIAEDNGFDPAEVAVLCADLYEAPTGGYAFASWF